jgi:hypothetical protein
VAWPPTTRKIQASAAIKAVDFQPQQKKAHNGPFLLNTVLAQMKYGFVAINFDFHAVSVRPEGVA